MNKIILGLVLVTISLSSFAQRTEKQKLIIEGIELSLYTAQMECYDDINGEIFSSEKLNLVKNLLDDIHIVNNVTPYPHLDITGKRRSLDMVKLSVKTNNNFTEILDLKLIIKDKNTKVETSNIHCY